MSKEELIAKIMTDVSDENLRNKLLASVAEGGPKGGSRESIVLNELEKLGINPNAAKDVFSFQFKVGVVVGYLLGGLFLIGGGLIALMNMIGGNIGGAIFGGIFALAGWYGLISTRKMAKLCSK